MNNTVIKRLFLCFIYCLFYVCGYSQQLDNESLYSRYKDDVKVLNTKDSLSTKYKNAYYDLLAVVYPKLMGAVSEAQSKKNTEDVILFAKACIDVCDMPQFANRNLAKGQFPTLVYIVANSYIKERDYINAARYLTRYLSLNVNRPAPRKVIFGNLAVIYQKHLDNHEMAKATLRTALSEMPNDVDFLSSLIIIYTGESNYDEAEPLVERACLLKPDDINLQIQRAQIYENQNRYKDASDAFKALAAKDPTSLSLYRHYATNLFNYAVSLSYNDISKSKAVFYKAIPVLQQYLYNDPNSVEMMQSLAECYLYTDDYDNLAATNVKLESMGGVPVGVGDSSQLLEAQNEATPKREVIKDKEPATHKDGYKFSDFARGYIEPRLDEWKKKDEYETVSEYKQRVNEKKYKEKIEELKEEAKEQYLSSYVKNLKMSDFDRKSYDADHGTFWIESKYGNFALPVPRQNDEARNFGQNWASTVKFANPVLDIAGEDIVIRSIDFVDDYGNSYHYSDADGAKYKVVDIDYNFEAIDYSNLTADNSSHHEATIEEENVTVGHSDVDINIPQSKPSTKPVFAFIIGNENYTDLASVPFSINDATIMAEYCEKTLGIPHNNIHLCTDVTSGQMSRIVRDMRNISESFVDDGGAEIIFYYSGHGMPDESSFEAFLVPTDVDGKATEDCYSIGRLYQDFSDMGAKRVLVFMDACFSGSRRTGEMLFSARGVTLAPRVEELTGKVFVFSASSGKETAYPYREKEHGMFTYFLLKYIQEKKGRVSLGELTEYVKKSVRQNSQIINNKPQTPSVNVSSMISDVWREWRLK